MVLLVPRQSRYTVIIDTKGFSDFSTESDILNFSQIIASIKDKDVEHIVAVRNYIEKEFPGECPAINWKSYDRVKSIKQNIITIYGEDHYPKYRVCQSVCQR